MRKIFLALAASAAVLIPASLLTYRTVEEPIRRFGRTLARRLPSRPRRTGTSAESWQPADRR